MGLDKKPVPPPKRVKEDGFKVGIVPRLTVTAGADTEATKDNPASRSECESSPTKDTEITAKEDKAPEDSKAKDDYEEDFEADDEEEKEKKSTSPNEEKEEKGKETDASDSEDSGKDDDRKSHSESSFSGSESDAEEVKEAKEEEGQDKPEDAQEVQEETQHVDAEAARANESTEAKDCEIQDSAGQSTEIEISDNSAPSGNENRATRDTRTAAEGERRTEDEPERAKSVQEKLAEAILKESNCSSEPELSDTSTETTEVGSNKSTEKETNVAEPVTTGQPEINEEKKSETVVQEEVKPEDETTKEPEQIAEVDTAQNDVTDKMASEAGKDEDTGEKGASEEIMEEMKCSPLQDEPTKEAEKDREESEQEVQSVQKEDESSGVDTKPDETAEANNTEPLTVTETMERKAEASDTQEAINTEVAPATDTQANDEQQDAAENTELESEVITKNGIMHQDDCETENAEVTDEVEEDKVDKQSDLNEDDKDKTQEVGDSESMGENKIDNTKEDGAEEAGKNSNTDRQDKDEGAKSETDDLENRKPESEPTKEEKTAECKDMVTDLNTGDPKGEDNKAPSEEDASDKPKEEIENAETGDVQNRDTSKEKCVGEDVKNEEEVEQLERDVRNDANKKLNESENIENAIQKEEEEQETTADSLKLTEENAPNEDNASDKPKEEVENIETSDYQNGDTSKDKCVDEDVKNTAPNKEEVQLTESEVGNDADKKLDESEQHESSVQKEEAEQETNSVKLIGKNVTSDEGAGVTEEALKEILNCAPASNELEKDNKSIDNGVDASEVDGENGEVSLVAETKQTDDDEQKQATTENTTQEEHDGVTQVEPSEKQENTELEPENDNSGNDLNGEASIPSNQEKIVHSLETAQSNSDKPTGEQVSAVDVFAGEGENGDTEEASKASEEGASVLLKPHDKSSLDEQNDQNEQKGSPEGLTTADSADLVNNWVTMHQTSKYFETFVEPLEGIRDVNSETPNAESEALPRSESPAKVVTDGEKGNSEENASKDETSDQGSNQSAAKQDVATSDVAQAEERDVIQVANVGNEENVKEECLRSVEDKIDHSTSVEEKTYDSFAQLNNNLTRTSVTSSGLSVTSGKHKSESLNEEKQSDGGQEVTMAPKAKAEELPENSDSLEAMEHKRENDENIEVSVTTDFTALKSDSGSQQGSNKIQTSSVSEDKREVMGESNTASKEHPSSFSVDDPVFGNSSFPLVTASNAESGH